MTEQNTTNAIRLTNGNPYAHHVVSTKAGVIRFSQGIATPTKEQREALDELGFGYESVSADEMPDDYGDPSNRVAARQEPPDAQVPAIDTDPKPLDELTQTERAHEGLPNRAANVVNEGAEDQYEADVEEAQHVNKESTAPRYTGMERAAPPEGDTTDTDTA